ncbi:hypothetical protein EFU43_00925 [Vibrio cholerae]|nr:hypothetical protein [Vibrio cholerae]TLE24353.1 hypothetical protein D2924_03625 [Vibrio cholerae]TLE36113.1 hypothetical protein D2925_04625 [Vibrio cholerae]
MQVDSYYREIPLSPSYLKLQRCWLRSLTPITVFIYAHGDYESQICSRQICHSLVAYLQLQAVLV